MPEHNILITDGLEENGQAILRSSARVDDRTGLSPQELLQVIHDYDALIVRSRTKVTVQVLDAAKRLKIVGRAGVGVDNIDLVAAKAHGVTVVNAPTSTSLAVAELTLGLMLSLAREIPRADAGMKQGEWLKKELAGTELYGKTLGILGAGFMGRTHAWCWRSLPFYYEPLEVQASDRHKYPLSAVTLAFLITRGIVAWLGANHLTITTYANVLLITVMYGAGTDYCLFLISRFREEMADHPGIEAATAHTVHRVGETIRDRLRLRGEVRTLTAQGRLSGIIVGSLPLVLGVLVGILDRKSVV